MISAYLMEELIMDKKGLAKKIDHTMLKIGASREDIIKICKEAVENKFASVAIFPSNIEIAKEVLSNSEVKICVAISYPFGCDPISSKIFEIKGAIKRGADELDMVMNISALKSGRYDLVRREFEYFFEAADGRVTKIILENSVLTKDEIITACMLAEDCGLDFVKTSTGFNKWGTTVDDVRLIKSIVGNKIKIKASGGIKTYQQAIELIKAGASRIGTSSSVFIVN